MKAVIHTTLITSTWEEPNLEWKVFEGAHFDGVNLEGANLLGADFRSRLEGVSVKALIHEGHRLCV
jgi:uncharacterized protein YjbI with pentapeptide repeats